MANLTCLNLLQVSHLRALRLAPDGSVAESEAARYEHQRPILFGYTPNQPEREEFEQLDGEGSQCAKYIAPPKSVDSCTLNLELCQLDAELTELLLGGSVITAEGGDDTIGYLSSTDSTMNEFGTAIEVWGKAWNRRQRAIVDGNPGYFRFAFAKTAWTMGQVTKDNSGFSTITLEGTAEVNSGFAEGFADDPFVADLGESVYGWAVVGDVPDGACGYQPVPAGS